MKFYGSAWKLSGNTNFRKNIGKVMNNTNYAFTIFSFINSNTNLVISSRNVLWSSLCAVVDLWSHFSALLLWLWRKFTGAFCFQFHVCFLFAPLNGRGVEIETAFYRVAVRVKWKWSWVWCWSVLQWPSNWIR